MEEDEFQITVAVQDEVFVVSVESGTVCDTSDDREVGTWFTQQRRIIFHAGPSPDQAPTTTAVHQQGTTVNPMRDLKSVEVAPKLFRNPIDDLDDILDLEQPKAQLQQRPGHKSMSKPKVEPVVAPKPQPAPVLPPSRTQTAAPPPQ